MKESSATHSNCLNDREMMAEDFCNIVLAKARQRGDVEICSMAVSSS